MSLRKSTRENPLVDKPREQADPPPLERVLPRGRVHTEADGLTRPGVGPRAGPRLAPQQGDT